MANFLGNIRYVSWTSAVLAALFLLIYGMGVQGRALTDSNLIGVILRWTHVAAGIMWIGHLYYFNFTQIP
ncbi:MAG: hypothetical protein NW200_03025, partial [Hyphomonadaceae bacterium]|nr:hypothetical protein [Hyphomonadaceae bacterium]